MNTLKNKVAIVTGASRGIGREISLSLARQGVKLCLVGRNLELLTEVTQIARDSSPQVFSYCVDLTIDKEIYTLKSKIQADCGQLDILIHSAGKFSMGYLQNSSVETFDLLYKTNIRAPYLLTQELLPMLLTSQGEIVFINSSVVFSNRANLGQYAATKHALKAIADSLREEVNAHKVRVLNIFPGRTATSMQAFIHKLEGTAYNPKSLMQPNDIADVVMNALSLPRSAEVIDIYLRPFNKLKTT